MIIIIMIIIIKATKIRSNVAHFVFFMKYSLILYIFITWTQRKFLSTPYDKLNEQFLMIMIGGTVNVT